MKYLIGNGRELSLAKSEALREYNFDQLENIIEYEDYLAKSYWAPITRDFVKRVKTQMGHLAN